MTVHAGLDTELSAPGIGQRTLYVAGWCFDDRQPMHGLQLLVDGRPQDVLAWGMPRFDVHRRFRHVTGARGNAYRSGFWAVIELPETLEPVRIVARAQVADTLLERPLGELTREAGHMHARRAAQRLDTAGGSPRIAICLATHNPRPGDVERQINSIRGQTYPHWTCVISDDVSAQVRFDAITRAIGGDSRFQLHRNLRRVGFYHNFEACLQRLPEDVEYVALSDQDDHWYPEKLATLLRTLHTSGAVLAYSDMRIKDERGRLVRSSFWGRRRRRNDTDLRALLCFNTIPGAACLMSREVVEAALPFPSVSGQFHDHWLACVALCVGSIAYVNGPLYDYIQHEANLQGHRGRWLRGGVSGGRSPQEWYFTNLLGATVFSSELRLRFQKRLPSDRQRALDQIAGLDSDEGRQWIRAWLRSAPLETRPPKLLAAILWRRWLQRIAILPTPLLTVNRSALPSVASGER